MLNHSPRYMMVEPTNHCNLACPLCPTGSGTLGVTQGFMDLGNYVRLINELSPELETILLWGFGEPLLHPEIFRMIAEAHSRGITTKVSTNGQCFGGREQCEEIVTCGLTQLRVSLDGLSDKTLQVYRRGASFEKIIAGLNYIIEAKRRLKSSNPLILLQFIAMKHNEHEANRIKALADEMGIAWRIKTASIGEVETISNYGKFLPDSGPIRYAVCDCAGGTQHLKPRLARPHVCPYPWLWAHVNWDGTVVPCCKDPHRQHLLGNAFAEGGFRAVWNNTTFVTFRETYLRNPAELVRCRKCDYPFQSTCFPLQSS